MTRKRNNVGWDSEITLRRTKIESIKVCVKFPPEHLQFLALMTIKFRLLTVSTVPFLLPSPFLLCVSIHPRHAPDDTSLIHSTKLGTTVRVNSNALLLSPMENQDRHHIPNTLFTFRHLNAWQVMFVS